MSLASVKRHITKLVLALMVAMHGNLLFAQSTIQATDDFLPENYPHPQDQIDDANINWTLLSGESVESLAALFYPKNKKMQRLFTSKTLQLSREIQPNLEAKTKSNQASLIITPNIKLLANTHGMIKLYSSTNVNQHKLPAQTKLHMSYGLKDAAELSLTPNMQATYEKLVRKNEDGKLELEKISAKLVHLQEVFAALNIEAQHLLSQSRPASSSIEGAVEKVENNQSQYGVIKNNAVKISAPVAEKIVTDRVQNSVVGAPVLAVAEESSSFISQYLIMPIMLLIAAIGLFLSFGFYKRRQLKRFKLMSPESFTAQTIAQPFSPNNHTQSVNSVDFSLTTSEYSDQISDVNLDAIMASNEKEKGELVMEQARIYVNINRENDAIMLLKAQIQSAPKTALHHWLYLLDIFRDTQQKEEFLKYASKLHQHFNVIQPLWGDESANVVVAASLEVFPHIVENLTRLWAEGEKDSKKMAETKAYLGALLTDNRNNERTGFGMDVFKEILLLRHLLDTRDKLAIEC